MLSWRSVARNAPDVMHDLRRTCAMCSGAKQCAPRLDRSPRLARRARLSEARSVFAFCPNAHTLAALADAVPANAAAGAPSCPCARRRERIAEGAATSRRGPDT